MFPILSEDTRCDYIYCQQIICRACCSHCVVDPSFQSYSSCGSSSRDVFTDGSVSRVLIREKSRCDSHEQPVTHRQHEIKRQIVPIKILDMWIWVSTSRSRSDYFSYSRLPDVSLIVISLTENRERFRHQRTWVEYNRELSSHDNSRTALVTSLKVLTSDRTESSRLLIRSFFVMSMSSSKRFREQRFLSYFVKEIEMKLRMILWREVSLLEYAVLIKKRINRRMSVLNVKIPYMTPRFNVQLNWQYRKHLNLTCAHISYTSFHDQSVLRFKSREHDERGNEFPKSRIDDSSKWASYTLIPVTPTSYQWTQVSSSSRTVGRKIRCHLRSYSLIASHLHFELKSIMLQSFHSISLNFGRFIVEADFRFVRASTWNPYEKLISTSLL